MQTIRTTLWQLNMPDEWRASIQQSGDGISELWNPEGVGKLTILVNDSNQAPSRTGTAHEFQGKLRGKISAIQCGKQFARHWTLLCGSEWIHVRYSCSAANAEIERAAVDEIVQSISEANR
jgi:hypothetical protein